MLRNLKPKASTHAMMGHILVNTRGQKVWFHDRTVGGPAYAQYAYNLDILKAFESTFDVPACPELRSTKCLKCRAPLSPAEVIDLKIACDVCGEDEPLDMCTAEIGLYEREHGG